jgi:hypothetical protein
MAKLRLIIEVTAATPRAAQSFANVLSDYADDQFEAGTMEGKPLSFMRSWIQKPKKDGAFQ